MTAPAHRLRMVAIAIACTGACFIALAGCSSSQHQIIGANQGCVSCHSDGRTASEPSIMRTQSTQLEITVKTSASTVAVCTPIYTGKTSVPYVPVANKTVNVTEGEAHISLTQGTWVIATTQSGVTKSIIIDASMGGEASELSL